MLLLRFSWLIRFAVCIAVVTRLLIAPGMAYAQSTQYLPSSGYTITDVGTISPTAINAAGQVTGTDLLAHQAIVWDGGTTTTLPPLSPGKSSIGLGINASGEVSGQATNASNQPQAAYWLKPQGAIDYSINAPFGPPSIINGLNDAGDLAGKAQYFDFDGNLFIYALVRLANGGTVHPFGTGADGTISAAYAVNNNQDITGYEIPGGVGSSYGFFAPGTGTAPISFLYPGASRMLPRSVNDSAQVVGETSGGGLIKAFYWQNNNISILPLLPGGTKNSAYSINSVGSVAGYAERNDKASNNIAAVHAVQWTEKTPGDPATYTAVDLDAIVQADPPQSGLAWAILSVATGINSHGQIVGTGQIGGETHGFLLSPPPGVITIDASLPNSMRPSVRPRKTYSQVLLMPLVTKYTKTITVTDEAGNRVPGLTLRLSITGNNIPAGHLAGHSPSSVHGWIFDPLDTDHPVQDDKKMKIDTQTVVGATDIGGSNVNTVLDKLKTDKNGPAQFIYIPAEVSGMDTLKAEVTSQIGYKPDTKNIAVQVPGLVPLPAPPLINGIPAYVRYGTGDTQHFRFAVSLVSAIRLQFAGQKYIDTQQKNPELQGYITDLKRLNILLPIANLEINDCSLPWGGIFDTGNDFAPPHGGHRQGNNADIGTTDLVLVSNLPTSGHSLPATLDGIPIPPQYVGKEPYLLAVAPSGTTEPALTLIKKAHYRQYQLLYDAVFAFSDSNAPHGGILQKEDAGATHFHVTFPR